MHYRRLIFCVALSSGCVDGTLGLTGVPDDLPPRDLYATRPTHLSAGPEHTCLLRDDGALWCWGSNDNGQITPGVWNVYEGNSIPAHAEGLELAESVAAGGDGPAQAHNCVVDSSKHVRCFGSAWNGQVGGVSSVGVADPLGLENIASVAAGGGHSCAVDQSGALYCWGDNRLGQLGLGQSSAPDKVPAKVNFPGKATMIALGTYHSCALDDTHQVWCWGNNSNFQLGVDVSSNATPPEGGGLGCGRDGADHCVNPSPVHVDNLPAIERIVASFGKTCALDVEGGVWCWGGDEFHPGGALPRKIEALARSFRVATGQNHSCAITADRHVWCWGANSDHQLGAFPQDRSNFSDTPVEVEGVTGAIEIALGAAHSCALGETGDVWCWGSNLKGQLGSGSEGRIASAPPGAAILENMTDLSARGSSACAISHENSAYCWGRLESSWSGKDALLPAAIPTAVVGLPEVQSIQTSGGHVCALAGDLVYCWGGNDRGQVSPGDAARIDVPVALENIRAVKISVGSEHTCLLGVDGIVRCWGDNSFLQMGSAAPEARLTAVPGVGDVFELEAAGTRTCVISGPDRGMSCWGSFNRGPGREPVRIPGLSGLTKMSLGNAHTCALDDVGRVFCFGSNSRGQLGDGCKYPTANCHDYSETPLLVPDVPPMRAISASAQDTCAIAQSDGAMWCWGDAHGTWTETPDGPRFKPVRVEGAPLEVEELDTGRNFACTLGDDRAVHCWGSNLSGERGDGQRFSTIPALVEFPAN